VFREWYCDSAKHPHLIKMGFDPYRFYSIDVLPVAFWRCIIATLRMGFSHEVLIDVALQCVGNPDRLL